MNSTNNSADLCGCFLHCCVCRYSADSVRLHPSHAYLRLGVSSARRRLSQLLPSRQQRDGTPRITVAIYQAAYPASYAQLTMAFEETQRLLSNAVPVGKWLKNWGTACAHGLTKRFCQLLSPTKRAAHAAVRIQAAVRGHQRRNPTKRAAVCASKRQCAAISVALLSPSTRVGPSTHRCNGARMGHAVQDTKAEDHQDGL